MQNVWLRKCDSFEEEEEADREFWAQMTGDERIEVLAQMRRDAWGSPVNVSKDFEELFGFFNARKVKALIVGGYAFSFHARPRATKDLDLLFEATPENAERLLQALDDFGFGSLPLTAEDLRIPGRILQLGYPPGRIDFMSSLLEVDFTAAWERRVSGHMIP